MDSEWKEKKLIDAMEIIGGGTPKTTNADYWGGKIPWLSVVDFNNDQRWVYSTEKSITEAGLKESSTKLLKPGQLIISARGTVGALAQLTKEMAFNQSCYGLNAHTEITSNDFLYYALKSIISDIKRSTHGAVFDTITKETFYHLKFNFPPLTYQKDITNILSSLDDKIELNRQMCKTLEDIASTLFKSWFIDFDPVKAKAEGRKPEGLSPEIADLFPDRFVDSPMGKIPEGWEVSYLGNILKNVKKSIKPSAETEQLPYVPIDCISSSCLTLEKYQPGNEAKSSLIQFTKGQIIFGAMRPYFHKVCIAPFDGTTRTTAFIFEPINEVDLGFSLMTVFDKNTIDYATNTSQGSTIPYAVWDNGQGNFVKNT